MAHGTRISGVNKDVTAGFTRINGVNKKVKKGLTLVGGVQKEIAFSNLPPIGTALNDCSWEDIAAISEAGMASSYWKIGDTKTITINGAVGSTTFSSLSVDVFILGFDHNSAKEGTNRIHFQIGKISGKDVCLCDSKYGVSGSKDGFFTMSTGNTNSGGWKSCYMRNTVLGSNSTPTSPTANTLLAALPSDLRSVMKPVTKYSDNTGGSLSASNVTATTDYLWLLAEFEVHGTQRYANSAEKNNQAQYDYYKAGNSKIKYKHNATGTAAYWWLRSVGSESTFCYVKPDGGSSGTDRKNYSYGVAPGFAV